MKPIHLCDHCGSPRAPKLPACPSCGNRTLKHSHRQLPLCRETSPCGELPPPPGRSPLQEGTTPKAAPPTSPRRTSGFRVLIAHLIDLALLISAGSAIFFIQNPNLELAHSSISIIPLETQLLVSSLATVICGTLYGILSGVKPNISLGRRLAGLKLVKKNGETLSGYRVVLRALVAPISLLFFGAGFFWALVDHSHRTWHDLCCGTRLSS